jgi:G3E family GTPase
MTEKLTQIIVLTGFLGSGKTTLLKRMLADLQFSQTKVALVINEIGEVNLDGLLVEREQTTTGTTEVAMRELLNGCICCTVRGDLSLTLHTLIEQENPDLIIIEATGAANPLELIEVITETSLLQRVSLSSLVTVVDSTFFFAQATKGVGKTWRLLREQVRAASVVVLNKMDRFDESLWPQLEKYVRACNAHATIELTERCALPFERLVSGVGSRIFDKQVKSVSDQHDHHDHDHDHHDHDHDHSAHNHLLVHTKYLSGPVDRRQFTTAMNELPENVYRAKGIVTFADSGERVMFQFAYRELECIPIRPQKVVPDVIVWIGEHLDVERLERDFEG